MSKRKAAAWFALKWFGFALAIPGLLASMPGNWLLDFAKDKERAEKAGGNGDE